MYFQLELGAGLSIWLVVQMGADIYFWSVGLLVVDKQSENV